MFKNNESLKNLTLCSLLILLFSYVFTAFAFHVPAVLSRFNYIMFIPAPIAALFIYIQTRSSAAVVAPFIQPIRWKAVGFAVLYPITVILLCVLVADILGLAFVEWQNILHVIRFPSLIEFIWAVLFIVGEEYAWRGYLFPGFSKLWGPVRAAFIVGILWAIWHGPIVYGLASHLKTSESPLLLTLVLMTVVFLFSFSFSYSYILSQNIIAPAIFHYVWNWINPTLLGNLYRNQPGLARGDILMINGEGVLGIIFGILFALWFVLRYRRSAQNKV